MARFRDMRKFARYVKDEHFKLLENKELATDQGRYGEAYSWPEEKSIIQGYAKKEKLEAKVVEDIKEDCMAFDYLRHSDHTKNVGQWSLVVTSKGRHLLLKLGLIREIAKDNSDWLNLFIVFLAGVLSAVIITLGSLWIFQHTKPTYVVPQPNVTVKPNVDVKVYPQ